MVKSYCVKQRKMTECVPNSIEIFVSKNNRLMMKCKWSECGITKTRFIERKEGQGFGKILEGINVGKKISTLLFPQTKKLFKDYESGKIAKQVVNKIDGVKTKRFWKPSNKQIVADRFLKGKCTRAFPMGKGKYSNVDCD